jgi:DNA-binding transcriptional LysR family regulator
LRSFRRASEELGISQASVSNQLKALEEQLGLRLLTRDSGRRPGLTPEGAGFLADLAPFWRAAGKLAAHRQSETQREAAPLRRIKAMVSMQLLEDYVRPKLGHFLREHSSIQLMFDSAAAYFGPRRSLAREYFDIGLFSENTTMPLEGGLVEVARIRCGIYGHRSFAEGRSLPLTPEEMSKLPFVMPPEGSFHESEMLTMLARHNIKPARIAARTQYFDVLSAMIEADHVVGVALEPSLRPEQRAVTPMLYRLDDWRVALYRNPEARQPEMEIVEKFLVSAIVDDPAYPKLADAD